MGSSVTEASLATSPSTLSHSSCTNRLNHRTTKMKWWFLVMGIALLQMAVFIENTEAKARDSDGDGISDVDDADDDNDGLLDGEDDDGDGIPDTEDEDHPDFDDENDEL